MILITIYNPKTNINLLADILKLLTDHGLGCQSIITDAEGIHIGHDFDKEPAMRRVTEEDYELIKLAKIRAGEFVPVGKKPSIIQPYDATKWPGIPHPPTNETHPPFLAPIWDDEIKYGIQIGELPVYPKEFSSWIALVSQGGGPIGDCIELFDQTVWDNSPDIKHPGRRGLHMTWPNGPYDDVWTLDKLVEFFPWDPTP